MKKLLLPWSFLALLLTLPLLQIPFNVEAQQAPGAKLTSGTENSNVALKASFSIAVSNQTLKMKEGMLKNAVIGFLNSGPNVLKAAPTDQPIVKTKINNLISPAIQLVEGTEATNAINAVEITKALKSLISSTKGPNQTAVITVEATSKCNSITSRLPTCDNIVNIK